MDSLTPADLGDPYLDRDFRERTDDSVVKVEHHSMERGTLTVFLEQGDSFTVRNDDPTSTTITVFDDE